MTTSKPPRAEGGSGDLPWARASLRVSGHRVDRHRFEAITRGLGNATGAVKMNTATEARIWIDDCPLASSTPPADQLAWAVGEAEAVFGAASVDLADCQLEVWLGLAVGAQLGVVCDSDALGRLAALSADLVLDLYGWD